MSIFKSSTKQYDVTLQTPDSNYLKTDMAIFHKHRRNLV